MFLKMLRTTLLAALLIFMLGVSQMAQAEEEPPAIPDEPTELMIPAPAALDIDQASPRALLTAPAGWENQGFDIPAIDGPAAADATITVNSTADLPDTAPADGVCAASNGKCTLRAALDTANAASNTDEIIVPAGVYVINSQLALTKPVVISGAGQAQTIVDGNNNTRAFKNFKNSGNNTIQNLTIRNAWNKITAEYEHDGGGVFNDGTLTLRNVTVSNCRAYEGGGVYNSYDRLEPEKRTLNLENVLITGNLATSTVMGQGGGGLFNGSRLNGVNVTITNNTASMLGGGFYNNSYEQMIVLRNFKINNNVSLAGSGIMSDLTKFELGYGVTLIDGEIANNQTPCCFSSSQGAPGGGIDNNESIMRLTNVSISGNVAANGPSLPSNASYGGAIVNIRYMELTNVSITGNSAYYGAGIFNGNYVGWGNQLTMVNVTVSGNTAIGPTGGTQGAGLFNTGNGRAKFVNSTITQNTAGYAGGIRINGTGGYVEMKNTILAGNYDSNGAEDCFGSLTSLGNNVVGNYLGKPKKNLACKYTGGANDLLGVNPAIGPLMKASYAFYHPLVLGSQAIDMGTNSECPATDVSGVVRPQGASCDVGADEFSTVGMTFHYLFIPLARK